MASLWQTDVWVFALSLVSKKVSSLILQCTCQTRCGEHWVSVFTTRLAVIGSVCGDAHITVCWLQNNLPALFALMSVLLHLLLFLLCDSVMLRWCRTEGWGLLQYEYSYRQRLSVVHKILFFNSPHSSAYQILDNSNAFMFFCALFWVEWDAVSITFNVY